MRNNIKRAQPVFDRLHKAQATSTRGSLSDSAFESLTELLRAAGDPLPRGRPQYSGLVGPVVSVKDGAVAWVSAGEGEREFHLKGIKAFAFAVDVDI